MALLLLILFLLFLFMGIPIVFAMALSALFVLMLEGYPLLIVVQRLFSGSNSFMLTAIPFFVLAGAIMSAGGITLRLIEFAQALVGHLRGGLGFVNIISSMIFGGVSGSATADTAAIGSVLIPAMEKEGYDKNFSAAITAAAGTLGIIIPPSIPMIIFGFVAGESIGRLFLGGIIPGIMVGFGLMIPTYVISRRRGYPKKKRLPVREILMSLKRSILAITMPVVIIGSIVAGVVTATEAGVLAVLYAALIGFFVYGKLRIADLPRILLDTVITSATIMIIMSVADIFSWLLAIMEVPQQVAAFMTGITQNRYLLLFFINIFLLVIGTFVDLGPAIIITTPILMPLTKAIGVDPTHFGLIVTINLGIGLFTPPVGTNLFVVCASARLSLEEVSRAIIPFIAWAVIVLLIITYIPVSVLFIPKLFMG